MKLQELFEAALEQREESKEEARLRPFLNRITQIIFKQGADWVKDKKRSKDAIFLGVAHTDSLIYDDRGKSLKLTFDNSTDSGEFELNSLTPLMIQKGSELDQAIISLYDKHHIKSTKKTNYMSREGKTVMREVHVGKMLDPHEVKFIHDLVELFSSKISRIN
jgi:hypothetical protein